MSKFKEMFLEILGENEERVGKKAAGYYDEYTEFGKILKIGKYEFERVDEGSGSGIPAITYYLKRTRSVKIDVLPKNKVIEVEISDYKNKDRVKSVYDDVVKLLKLKYKKFKIVSLD